jgi:hypothetical protein
MPSCHFQVISSVFGDPCPDTEKYVEVHYHCVHGNDITTKKNPVPPWFFDLSATFVPEVSSPRVTTERTKEEEFNNAVSQSVSEIKAQSETTEKEIMQSSTNSHVEGRYFLIKDHDTDNYSADEDNKITLIVAITISTIATIVCVLIFSIIFRKYNKQMGSATHHSCYDCEPSKQYYETTNGSAIPNTIVQNRKEPSTVQSLQEAKSLPYLNTIYSGEKVPKDKEDHPYQLYSLSADMIGGDNYVTRDDRHRQVIMNTIVDGDDGDIRVIKPEVSNVWASNHSLPNRNSASCILKHTQNCEEVSNLSPIQILFSDKGEHFVNFQL